jgi:acetyl-CoA synthetase
MTVPEKQKLVKERYELSVNDPNKFWSEEAFKHLSWSKPFSIVSEGEFAAGSMKWFSDGKLNACYNAVDRHVENGKGDQVAMIWEGDEAGNTTSITFRDMYDEINRIANVMKAHGVKKGDVVTFYMPMIPQLPLAMLACARIGAIHSVVFAGFSSDALRDRIRDCNSSYVFVADEGRRGGKSIKLKSSLDVALDQCPQVKSVFVFNRAGQPQNMTAGRDFWMTEEVKKVPAYCPIEAMNSEDPLLILYTSGSTGKPKGIVHSTGGYILYAAMTAKNTFDLRENDVFCCVADCGWITGHSYIVYGPLINGVTTVLFESIPTYPDPYRYWDLIQRVKATQFYTAPTAIRALMRYDPQPISNYDLSSLRILGSVGEPINPEAWVWYYEHVGKKQCTVVDTYWQTETGGHIITNQPGATPMKPGSCNAPSFGIQVALLDAASGKEIEGNEKEGVLALKSGWPGMARTLYGDHERFLNTYMRPYPGYYFTGDACRRDEDGSIWITGRVDDVINPSGHRIGTAELEAVLDSAPQVSESAVVGFPHDLKGEGIGCYVVLKEGVMPSEELTRTLKESVRKAIGPIATPDFIIYSELPKTRSGKIMRRILRKIAAGDIQGLGDTSTLADPGVVPKLIESYNSVKTSSAAAKI